MGRTAPDRLRSLRQAAVNILTQQDSVPDPRAVIEAIARRDQIRLLVDGKTAANDLGFTIAVPAEIIVHREARGKSIKLGNLWLSGSK